MLCGNSNGCSTTRGCRPRKSLTAAANVGLAVVNTSAVCPGSSTPAGGRGTLDSNTRQPRPAANVNVRSRQRRANMEPTRGILTGKSLLGRCGLRSHAANEIDDVPHVSLAQRVLHRLHFRLGCGGPVPDDREDLAIAGS